MISNSSNSKSAPTAAYTDWEEQMAFDQLDPKLRWFIANAPEKLSCVWVHQKQVIQGADITLQSGLRMIASRYPEFKWPNGAPW